MSELKDKIEDALREVYDPEIPINVYDLGLIYEINVENSNAKILMTFTSPTCPTADYLENQVKEAAQSVEGIDKAEVTITFEPAWSPERVSQEAKEELGLSSPSEDLAVKQVFDDSVSKEEHQKVLDKVKELEEENSKLKEELKKLKKNI